jgi:hypothetical protein
MNGDQLYTSRFIDDFSLAWTCLIHAHGNSFADWFWLAGPMVLVWTCGVLSFVEEFGRPRSGQGNCLFTKGRININSSRMRLMHNLLCTMIGMLICSLLLN